MPPTWLAAASAWAAAPAIPPGAPFVPPYNQASGIPQLNGDARLDPRPLVPTRGLRPKLHLPKLAARIAASQAATVCIAGDSTGTVYDYPTGNGGANAVAPSELLWTNLVRRIREDNPGATISFANRDIGAQTWATLYTTANWPGWYFNQNLPWLPYVRAAQCDTLFINSGVNDTYGLTGLVISNTLNKVVGWGTTPPTWAASTAYGANSYVLDASGNLYVNGVAGTSGATTPGWPASYGGSVSDGGVTWYKLTTTAYTAKVPDVVLITNKNASPNAPSPYNLAANETGYLTAAAFQRTLAANGGKYLGIAGLPNIGLIDIGRYFTEVYGGYNGTTGAFAPFDPANQYLRKDLTLSGTTGITVGTGSPGYSFPVNEGGDGDIDVTFPGGVSSLASSQLIFNLGGYTGTTASNLKVYKSGTQVTAQLNTDGLTGTSGNGGLSTGSVWTGTAGSNATDLHVRITFKQGWIQVLANPETNQTPVMDALLPRWVGRFTPTLTISSPPGGGAAMTVNAYSTGVPLPTLALYSDAVTYGAASGATGGNSINHTASPLIGAVDAIVLDAQNFCATCN